MWEHVGVKGSGHRLLCRPASSLCCHSRTSGPTDGRNLAAVAELVTETALDRTESRGGHYRLDHPETDSGVARHTHIDPHPETTVELRAQVRGAA